MPLDPFTGHVVSAATFARVTSKIAPTLAAHPGWSETEARRFLRGHGVPGSGVTPEHGELTKTIAHGRAGNVTLDRPTYRDSKVIGDVNRAANSDRRVAINVRTKAGGIQQIGSQRGYSASYVAQVIADHNGDVRAAIAELLDSGGDNYDVDGYGSSADYTAAIDAWQVVAYE